MMDGSISNFKVPPSDLNEPKVCRSGLSKNIASQLNSVDSLNCLNENGDELHEQMNDIHNHEVNSIEFRQSIQETHKLLAKLIADIINLEEQEFHERKDFSTQTSGLPVRVLD